MFIYIYLYNYNTNSLIILLQCSVNGQLKIIIERPSIKLNNLNLFQLFNGQIATDWFTVGVYIIKIIACLMYSRYPI